MIKEIKDNWKNREDEMRCHRCMWFIYKEGATCEPNDEKGMLGHCRKQCPTSNGWPGVFAKDWCGDHKLR